jgi:hypothetical protein
MPRENNVNIENKIEKLEENIFENISTEIVIPQNPMKKHVFCFQIHVKFRKSITFCTKSGIVAPKIVVLPTKNHIVARGGSGSGAPLGGRSLSAEGTGGGSA